jgi:hypothetical protein
MIFFELAAVCRDEMEGGYVFFFEVVAGSFG